MHAAAVICFCGDNPAAGLAMGCKESVSATAPCRPARSAHWQLFADHLRYLRVFLQFEISATDVQNASSMCL